MRRNAFVVLGSMLAAAACSSSSNAGGGSGGGSGGGVCATVPDLCAEYPVAMFVAACGTSATSAQTLNGATQPSGALRNVQICNYTQPSGPTTLDGALTRTCISDAPTAMAYYTMVHDANKPADQVDVTGVGDAAFFRPESFNALSSLYVVQGNRVLELDVTDGASPTPDVRKQCLITIATAFSW